MKNRDGNVMSKDLLAWAEMHIKHKDIFEKNILDYHIHDDSIDIERKDGSHELYLILSDTLKEFYQKSDVYTTYAKVWLVLKDSEHAIKEVFTYWDFLSSHKHYRIWFIDTKRNARWAINPYAHSMVASKKNLMKSLQSLRSAI